MRLWRRREDPRIRYYLYVSDTKLDMLFEQIDQRLRKRISAELQVDLKLISVTVRNADNPALTRAAKLCVVECFLDRYHHVGTIDEPGDEYFRGAVKMGWGWLGHSLSPDPVTRNRPEMVFFQGWHGHHTVGLAGSPKHVLGSGHSGEDVRWGYSSLRPYILKVLHDHVASEPDVADSAGRMTFTGPFGNHGIGEALNNEWFFPEQRPGEAPRLEFLAVSLQQVTQRQARQDAGFGDARHTVLGTPLYVAVASEPGQVPEHNG